MGDVSGAGLKLDIDAAGCVKAGRTAKDGVVYFGVPQSAGKKRNDVELVGVEGDPGTRLFKIYYAKKENEYFLKDLGTGAGTFVRVDRRTPLLQGSVISFGQHHIVVTYRLCGEPDPDSRITLQLIDDAKGKTQ